MAVKVKESDFPGFPNLTHHTDEHGTTTCLWFTSPEGYEVEAVIIRIDNTPTREALKQEPKRTYLHFLRGYTLLGVFTGALAAKVVEAFCTKNLIPVSFTHPFCGKQELDWRVTMTKPAPDGSVPRVVTARLVSSVPANCPPLPQIP